jgi:hypothetical protein
MNKKVDELSEKFLERNMNNLMSEKKRLFIISPKGDMFREILLKTFLNN